VILSTSAVVTNAWWLVQQTPQRRQAMAALALTFSFLSMFKQPVRRIYHAGASATA